MIFADTSYWIALLNPADSLHTTALRLSTNLERTRKIVTSDFVLVELLNSLPRWSIRPRLLALSYVEAVQLGQGPRLVAFSDSVVHGALDLMRQRLDKSWSFVDCTSFVIMREQGIREALSADHHFEQAGFSILLK